MENNINIANSFEPVAGVDEERKFLLRLTIGFWLIAVVLGLIQTWADHHYLINSDTLSYLDIAETYLRRDWHNAINSYWSPLYSWLIALALLIVRPSAYWKFSVIHLLNFVIFLVAMGCFTFLIGQLVRFHREIRSRLAADKLLILPDWALLAIGYPLFIWSSLFLIGVREESPDLLIAAIVYLACGLLIRIRRKPGSLLPFALLGGVLGFGYLAKTVMFPLSFIFFATALLVAGNLRKSLPRFSLTLLAFLLIAGPFIFAISRSKGRFTYGDSGKLNYLWAINKSSERSGTRLPARKLLDNPAIYEFDHTVGGTYPVWYDPSYWFEESTPHFSLMPQLKALVQSSQGYYEIMYEWGVQYALMVAVLLFYLMGRRGWRLLRDLSVYSYLLIPGLAGVGIYALINVQGRYVAPFLMLLWLTLFCSVRLPEAHDSQRLIASLSIILSAMLTATIFASSVGEAGATLHYIRTGEDRSTHEQWQIAEGVHQMGIQPGDTVAIIGKSKRAFWANLAGVRIVSEIESADADNFWNASDSIKSKALEVFASTGARVIVAQRPVDCVDVTGWQRIANTDYYAYVLPK